MIDQRRRRLLAAGAAMTTGLAGCLGSGSEETEEETYDDWFSNANNFDGTVDRTDVDETTVVVGASNGLAFDPAAIRVAVGTTVVWEWSGQGGSHNVVEENGVFESELVGEAGATYEYTFEEPGVYRYVCAPHQASGMVGAVHVVE